MIVTIFIGLSLWLLVVVPCEFHGNLYDNLKRTAKVGNILEFSQSYKQAGVSDLPVKYATHPAFQQIHEHNSPGSGATP